jgi:RHS repeat-associated protein
MRSVATQNFCIKSTKATGREHASINADSEPEIEGYNPAGISPEDGNAMRLYQRQWQYDNVGNILQLIHQANNNNWTRNYNYAANNNRLMSTENGNADVNYTYNEHGSMTAMPHLQNMQWDFAERLSHITRGTTEAYYNYDGRGQRVRKVVEKNNVVEERLYLGGFEIWRKKINGTLDTERETLHVMDDVKRIAIVETLTVNNGTIVNNPITVQRYQFSNNIESATLELDENANIISYEEYYPYGETSYRAGRNITETGQKRYRYTGKEKDEESGLYYYGARYYACWLGRWIATDPAGLVDGLNLYMYCSGNPLSKIDPSGMFDIETDTINKARRVFEPASTTVAKINIPSEQLTEIRPAVATQGGANFLMDKNFSTLDEAGKFAIENINQQSIDENVEMGGMIYEAEGRFYITSPYKSPNEDKINLPYISTAVISGEIPKIGKLVGMYHTHANSTKEIDMSFSSDDIDLMKDNKIVGYLGTNAKNAAGHKFFEGIQKFDPSKLSPTTPTFKIKEIGYIDYNEYVNYDINDDDFHKRIELAKYTKYANYYIKHIEFLIEKEVITNVK